MPTYYIASLTITSLCNRTCYIAQHCTSSDLPHTHLEPAPWRLTPLRQHSGIQYGALLESAPMPPSRGRHRLETTDFSAYQAHQHLTLYISTLHAIQTRTSASLTTTSFCYNVQMRTNSPVQGRSQRGLPLHQICPIPNQSFPHSPAPNIVRINPARCTARDLYRIRGAKRRARGMWLQVSLESKRWRLAH